MNRRRDRVKAPTESMGKTRVAYVCHQDRESLPFPERISMTGLSRGQEKDDTLLQPKFILVIKCSLLF